MWYLIVLLMWRLVTPILKLHWLFLPLSVVVSVLGGFWNTDLLMLPRFLGLLPFFVLGLHLKARHLAHLDDVWVRVAAVPGADRDRRSPPSSPTSGPRPRSSGTTRATRTWASTRSSRSRPASP